MNRTFFNKVLHVHVIFATFLLPVTMLFAVTGFLHTWEIKGGYTEDRYQINLKTPLSKNVSALHDLVKHELENRNIRFPKGWYGLVESTQGYHFESRGYDHTVMLYPADNPRQAELIIRTTSLLRKLVLLHKAEGSQRFKIYSSVFAIVLVGMFISGFIMSLSSPKLRKLSLSGLSFSLLLFFILLFLEST